MSARSLSVSDSLLEEELLGAMTKPFARIVSPLQSMTALPTPGQLGWLGGWLGGWCDLSGWIDHLVWLVWPSDPTGWHPPLAGDSTIHMWQAARIVGFTEVSPFGTTAVLQSDDAQRD